MKLGYYPGCTLKTKAANLEEAAMASLDALGVEYMELDRWNCCGAVFSLADDDLIHHVAPVRNLVRAQEQGADTVVTICSQCYNTLARANLLMREDEEKRDTINRFMDEEPDYHGEVEVMHYLTVLQEQVGWDKLAAGGQGAPRQASRSRRSTAAPWCARRRSSIDPLGDGILEEFSTPSAPSRPTFSAADRVLRLLPDARPPRGGHRAGRQGDRLGQPQPRPTRWS